MYTMYLIIIVTVRSDALDALARLSAETLAPHAPAIVAKLKHKDSGVRSAALQAQGQPNCSHDPLATAIGGVHGPSELVPL